MSIIGILLFVLILCVVIWAVRALLAAFSVPEPIATVVWVVAVLLCLLAALDETGVLGTGLSFRLR